MTIREIVIEYLKKNGYDGLCYPNEECGCYIDHDFMPCCNPEIDECMPGCKQLRDDSDWEIVIKEPDNKSLKPT